MGCTIAFIFPCCPPTTQTEKPAMCSTLSRVAIFVIGLLVVTIGILAFASVSVFQTLGISGGSVVTVLGGLMICGALFLRCIQKLSMEDIVAERQKLILQKEALRKAKMAVQKKIDQIDDEFGAMYNQINTKSLERNIN